MNDGMNLLRVGNQDKRRLETQHVSSLLLSLLLAI